ncbi:MAG: hypothetical protein ACSHX9_12165 [Luteolibacter sp.]
MFSIWLLVLKCKKGGSVIGAALLEVFMEMGQWASDGSSPCHCVDELPLADDGGFTLQALGQFAFVTQVEVEGFREVLAGVGCCVGSEVLCWIELGYGLGGLVGATKSFTKCARLY